MMVSTEEREAAFRAPELSAHDGRWLVGASR